MSRKAGPGRKKQLMNEEHVMAKLLRYIEESDGRKDISAKELAEKFNYSNNYISQCLQALARQGKIRKVNTYICLDNNISDIKMMEELREEDEKRRYGLI